MIPRKIFVDNIQKTKYANPNASPSIIEFRWPKNGSFVWKQQFELNVALLEKNIVLF